jgi:hypothetical protein
VCFFTGLVALGLTAAASGADLGALERAWSGSHDSREQVTVGAASGGMAAAERRVRTLVTPVQIPWLGSHALYLEEFPHDEPQDLRRQLLIQLAPAGTGAHEIRARLFTFVNPGDWAELAQRPQLKARLKPEDLQSLEGCDLLLIRQGQQFEGGTAGSGCLTAGGADYIDYQLVVGEGLYWYRRRLIRVSDGMLKEEVIGFNWFELHEARLFTCRIDWSPTGDARDLKPLLKMDLHDKGGHGDFVLPDGRRLELTLHSQDWPFAAEHDALVLLVGEPGQGVPLAAAWAVVDQTSVALSLGWLRARCGSLEPGEDELHG